MIRRQHIEREFFEEAVAMREALDTCFKDAYAHTINWHYFCDPRMYTYLRAAPRDVIPPAVFERFISRLRQWCIERLGLVPMYLPYLHLMVNGCRLGLHSDFHNGAWGYVYSLTNWENRRFSGGETLLMRDGVPSYKRHHVHGEVLYELIPAQFNQLLVFDDRIVHGTPTIEGSMDPMDGRIALVGHIRATSPLVLSGGIRPADARKVVLESLPRLRDRTATYKDVQGTITYRLTVSATGAVDAATVLTDNIVTPHSGYDRSDTVAAVKSIIQQAMMALRFPVSAGTSTVVVAVLFPIPDLRAIEFAVPCTAPLDVIAKLAETRQVGYAAELELDGEVVGDTFDIREPVAGAIRAALREILVSFDPPMWVPSQRERFQATLTEWIKAAAKESGAGSSA